MFERYDTLLQARTSAELVDAIDKIADRQPLGNMPEPRSLNAFAPMGETPACNRRGGVVTESSADLKKQPAWPTGKRLPVRSHVQPAVVPNQRRSRPPVERPNVKCRRWER
jgi:hypothetical protein